MVTGILPEFIDSVWSVVRVHIQKALDRDHNRVSIAYIYDSLKKQEMQMWVCYQGDSITLSVITKIELNNAGKSLRVLFGGGQNIEDCKHIMGVIENYAKHHDCFEVEIAGREGWSRIFKDYQKDYIVLRKPLYGR